MKGARWLLLAGIGLAASAVAAEPSPVIFHVSPAGDDSASGDAAHPFRTLARAQQAVRGDAGQHDVTVLIADGDYQLAAPLAFSRLDGGRNGHLVTWTAAPGASPVISGGMHVRGWRPSAAGRGIWEADVPEGVDTRQLWVDGHLAQMAQAEIPREAVAFSETGVTLKDGRFPDIAQWPDRGRLEIEGTGYFTDRFSPVARIEGRTLVMEQPAWVNNNWG
jgi:hypothetical protein